MTAPDLVIEIEASLRGWGAVYVGVQTGGLSGDNTLQSVFLNQLQSCSRQKNKQRLPVRMDRVGGLLSEKGD